MPQKHHLPWNAANRYWIVVKDADAAYPALQQAGYSTRQDVRLIKTEHTWVEAWNQLATLLIAHDVFGRARIAVIPSESEPSSGTIEQELRGADFVSGIAKSLWLGDALMENRLVCYLQPIVDAQGMAFGYEAFARVEQGSETVVGGASIVEAGRALNIEYRLDRFLHHKAIEAYVEFGYGGPLFINFFAGFIHRPEIYLDNLKREIERYGIPSNHIVLDITRSEAQKNMGHLKAIGDYCRQQGYAIALDDITNLRDAERLIHGISPDFIKMDHALTQSITQSSTQDMIQQLVQLSHIKKAKVIGERIESEDVFLSLKSLQVDLFQGYYFGTPFPVRSQNKAQASS
ncbi:MAG: EAL domain-containing protein [Rickettsiales bacterium]